MKGFRELDAAEMARVEGGGILSSIGNFFGGLADDLGSTLAMAWRIVTNPGRFWA
jgi:hypothetical protein